MTLTLQSFLAWLLTAAGATAATYGAMELLKKLFPRVVKDDFAFYLAMALALLLPLTGYALAILLGIQVFAPETLFQAILAGYFASQAIHRATKAGDSDGEAGSIGPTIPSLPNGGTDGLNS